MKKLHTYLITFLILLTTVSNTFGQDTLANNQILDKLIGTWVWSKSYGGITNRIETPKTTGYNLTVEISKDSLYKLYKNEKLQKVTKFIIDMDEYMQGDGMLMSFGFGGKDTLYLNDICCDCLGNMYLRKK